MTDCILLIIIMSVTCCPSQLHFVVVKQIEDFVENIKTYNFRVRVTYTICKKEYGSKLKINVYRHFAKCSELLYLEFCVRPCA